MFRLSQVGPVAADSTATYEVILDKEYTVRTFIKEVRKRKGDWGYVGIEKENSVFGDPVCEYRYGKLLSIMKKEVLNKPVISVKANGGYTRMDYWLKIWKSHSWIL